MDVPSQLRWIGPLFGGIYIIFWLTQGYAPFWAMTVFSIGYMIIVPQFLIQAIIVVVLFAFARRYRFASGIFFLSYFCSGISIQPIPIPMQPLSLYYVATIPTPPPIIRSPLWIFMITPSMAATHLILFLQELLIPAAAWLLFLLLLAILTTIITGLATEGKIDAVTAMLFFVIIIVCWTFSVIPLGMFAGSHSILTPVPLGPLVALNALQYIPLTRSEDHEMQRLSGNQRFQE